VQRGRVLSVGNLLITSIRSCGSLVIWAYLWRHSIWFGDKLGETDCSTYYSGFRLPSAVKQRSPLTFTLSALLGSVTSCNISAMISEVLLDIKVRLDTVWYDRLILDITLCLRWSQSNVWACLMYILVHALYRTSELIGAIRLELGQCLKRLCEVMVHGLDLNALQFLLIF
jgi:hypothetical protein